MADTDTLELRLRAVRWEADGILSMELAAPDNRVLPGWEVGAHVDLHLPNGIVRSYSLVNQPGDNRRYLVAVALDRQSRGGSRFVHQSLRPGQMIKVGLPRNHFPLVESGGEVVLIAGGIGVTPLYAMATALELAGRPYRFIYATRSRAHAAFTDTIANFGDKAAFHFDDEHGGKPLDIAGVIAAAGPGAHFYCCGPAGMLTAFEQATAHLAPEHVHIERFTAKPVDENATSSGFKIVLARSGKELTVPADKSILDVLIDHDIQVPYSCQDGICGSCETKVLAGQPDHRDSVLTAAEQAANKTMMVCISRCKGDSLTLDL